MVPLIIDAVGPVTSVLDVGCGVGAWLAEWANVGIDDYFGVDGDYVDQTSLKIPADHFKGHDLQTPLDLGRTFDVVTSFEVAEHIPEEPADQFVESLVRHGDVVVFSAAIPAQGGVGHVNEQWQTYWQRKFAQQGLEAHDYLRWKVWEDDRVEFWYAQNTVVYARPGKLASEARAPIDVAHPGYEAHHRTLPFKWRLYRAMPEGFRRQLHEIRQKVSG
jgi:SAM-dependent methyltransferase